GNSNAGGIYAEGNRTLSRGMCSVYLRCNGNEEEVDDESSGTHDSDDAGGHEVGGRSSLFGERSTGCRPSGRSIEGGVLCASATFAGRVPHRAPLASDGRASDRDLGNLSPRDGRLIRHERRVGDVAGLLWLHPSEDAPLRLGERPD